MKLVDVAEFYAEQGGGVRTYLDHKLAAGTRSGHEIVIVAPGKESREEPRQGGRIVWVESPPVPGDNRYRLFVHERRVHEVLDREKPDVVEASSVYGGGWFAGRWLGPAKKSLVFHQDPVAVFGHTTFDRWFRPATVDWAFGPIWSVLRRLSGLFDTTVVASDWLEKRLRGQGMSAARSVPFGIDAGPFAEAQPNEELRRRLLWEAGVSPEGRLLVAVSRHHPEKRLPTLIEAMRRLGQAQPIGLVIYGDGPSRRRVDRLSAQTVGVHVAGYTRDRSEMARAIASADAFVHGSAAETYGLVVAEALCAGTPVVVPDSGGAAEIPSPAVSERYRAGDPEACAAAIRRLLSRDKTELDAALNAARSQVRTLDDHFRELFEYYENLGAPPVRPT
ncbi:MAG: glycosyltransferase [Myxococcota bacterium]